MGCLQTRTNPGGAHLSGCPEGGATSGDAEARTGPRRPNERRDRADAQKNRMRIGQTG